VPGHDLRHFENDWRPTANDSRRRWHWNGPWEEGLGGFAGGIPGHGLGLGRLGDPSDRGWEGEVVELDDGGEDGGFGNLNEVDDDVAVAVAVADVVVGAFDPVPLEETFATTIA